MNYVYDAKVAVGEERVVYLENGSVKGTLGVWKVCGNGSTKRRNVERVVGKNKILRVTV